MSCFIKLENNIKELELFSHQILAHIDGTGHENDEALDDILHIRVDAQKGESTSSE